MPFEKRPLSNDDIITDMISEIKVEKTLLLGTLDGIIDDMKDMDVHEVDRAHNETNCIDPQLLLLQSNGQAEEDAELTEGDNKSVNNQAQHEVVEHDLNDCSTLDMTEPDTEIQNNGSKADLKKPQVNLPATTLSLSSSASDDLVQSMASPSASQLFERSFEFEDPFRLDIVRLDESDHDESDEQRSNDVNETTISYLDNGVMNRYSINDSIGDQVFPDSFRLSFSSNLDLTSPILGDQLTQEKRVTERKGGDNEVPINVDKKYDRSCQVPLSQLREDFESFDHFKKLSSRIIDTHTPTNSPTNSPTEHHTDTQHHIVSPNSPSKANSDEIDIISAVQSTKLSPTLSDSATVKPLLNESRIYELSQNVPGQLQYQTTQEDTGKRYRTFSSGSGLRLITSGSSIEHRIVSNGSRTAIESTTVLHRPTTVESLKSLAPAGLNGNQVSRLEQLENMRSSFNLKSNESLCKFQEDDRLTNQNLDELLTKVDIAKSEIASSNVLSSSITQGDQSTVYTGTSLLNILANDLARNFPSTSVPEPTKDYTELKNKDDWIKSLNSAFQIDEDLMGELQKMGALSTVQPDYDYVGNLTSDEQIKTEDEFEKNQNEKGTVILPQLHIKKRNITSGKSPLLTGVENHQPQSQSSETNKVLNNDKKTGFFSKLSARIASNSGNFNISNSKTTSAISQQSKQSLAKNGELGSAELRDSISSPGTVTAKLLEENGIKTYKSLKGDQMHFVETIESSKAAGVGDGYCGSQDLKVSTGIDLNIDPKDGDHNTFSSWKLNNRFMDFNFKYSVHRKKTIRKIFTSRSKESSTIEEKKIDQPNHASPPKFNDEKLAWKNSIFGKKKKTIKKRKISENISMDSGVSLEPFGPEHHPEFQGLEFTHQSKDFWSTETKDAKKIISMTNFKDKDAVGFTQISNGQQLSRDSDISLNSGDTLGSFLSEKLDRSKLISEYVKTPVPTNERSFSGFYRKRHLRLSFMKRNKTMGNLELNRRQSIIFAPTPEYFRSLDTRSPDGVVDQSHNIELKENENRREFKLQPQKSILQKPTYTKANSPKDKSFLDRLKSVYIRK